MAKVIEFYIPAKHKAVWKPKPAECKILVISPPVPIPQRCVTKAVSPLP